MKKLLIILPLVMSLNPTTYGEEPGFLSIGQSLERFECRNQGRNCIRNYADMEVDEQNPDHEKLMRESERKMLKRAQIGCGVKNELTEVIQLTPTRFFPKFIAFYVNGEWGIVAQARFICALK